MLWNDKTEAPSAHKREQARKQGTVAKSAELTGTAVMLFAVAVGAALLPAWSRGFAQAWPALLLHHDWVPLLREGLVKPIGFLCGFMIVAALAGIAQTRLLFTMQPLQPDWQKVNPLAGLQRMFSGMAAWELARSTMKAGLLGYIGYETLSAAMSRIMGTSGMSIPAAVGVIGAVSSQLLWRCVIALLLLSALDYFIQWRRVEQQLRMSKQEVKDELKQTEGNPQIKAQIRRRYRQLATNRQIQRVRTATVVIANPTHVAVVLDYRPRETPSPQIVGKGTEWLAQRLIREARAHNVPVVQNPPLARALVKHPIGALIPPELYQAVAEVLAYVYRVSGRSGEVLGKA